MQQGEELNENIVRNCMHIDMVIDRGGRVSGIDG